MAENSVFRMMKGATRYVQMKLGSGVSHVKQQWLTTKLCPLASLESVSRKCYQHMFHKSCLTVYAGLEDRGLVPAA